jgi:hypothetical protein
MAWLVDKAGNTVRDNMIVEGTPRRILLPRPVPNIFAWIEEAADPLTRTVQFVSDEYEMVWFVPANAGGPLGFYRQVNG